MTIFYDSCAGLRGTGKKYSIAMQEMRKAVNHCHCFFPILLP